ncbi:hypothetical protein HORM4_440023 [Vibrio harveyi]|nr:hypothetical protein HORM4_440023 [Vibrio harveyi]
MVGKYSDYWSKTNPKELANTNDDKGLLIFIRSLLRATPSQRKKTVSRSTYAIFCLETTSKCTLEAVGLC